MNELALDTETTTFNKGSPYDPRNSLVCYSYASDLGSGAVLGLRDVAVRLSQAKLVIGFNFKFDLAWFRRCGIHIRSPIWDVQVAEFILSHQKNRFPSLNETCIKYGIPVKHDVVKTEYWDKGIDTKDIPWDVLGPYAEHDAVITLQCYYKQIALMSPQQKMLCRLMCQDLVILQEMEENGLPFNEELCRVRAEEIDDKISKIEKELQQIYPNIPINFASNDDLSAFLYGGIIYEDGKELIGQYKTGAKAGQPKYKNVVYEHHLPRVYTPIKGSELKKEGFYATDESTLRKLKGKQKNISLVLELSKLQKLNGTYYRGLTKLRQEQQWPEGILHGQFNQTTAQTGRLSSSKPNLQNFASELQDIFVSKYNE